MVACITAQSWAKRLVCFTLCCFLFLLLAGPILSLLITMMVVGLIIFLLWLPLHTVVFGPNSAWRMTRESGSRWRRQVAAWWHVTGWCCGGAFVRMTDCVRRCWPPVRGVVREGLSGAAIALLVVLLAGVDEPAAVVATLVGTLAGGVVGITER